MGVSRKDTLSPTTQVYSLDIRSPENKAINKSFGLIQYILLLWCIGCPYTNTVVNAMSTTTDSIHFDSSLFST